MHSLRTHCITALLLCCSHTAPLQAIDYSDEYAEDIVREDAIPRAQNLAADARRSCADNIPIMIEFSTEWCTYCEALEQQVLAPMLKSGDYDDRMILRKLMVDDNSQLTDFDGSKINATSLGHRAAVELYPTIVFFDANGEEVAERIVGITVLEFVPQKIDKALERARRELSSTPSGEIRRSLASCAHRVSDDG